MIAPNHGASLGAILHFQKQCASLSPRSERAEITERAISIAVQRSFQSASDQHFDIWRNASFAYRRAEKRRRKAHSQLKGYTGSGVGIAATGGQAPPTPEELLVAADLEARLRLVSAHLHPLGARTLEGMLTGESENETAQAAGVAPRTIRRVKGAIRSQARRLIGSAST